MSIRVNATHLFRGLLLSTFFIPALAFAQESSVQPLIVQPVDETRLTVLKGNTHPLARPRYDQGSAPASLPMQRMLLVLKRSSEQETGLRKILDNQQDKASPSYHKWFTPEQFGKQFGLADNDLQTITAWLQSHGFQVSPTKGRTVMEFSGTAGQVQEAFHTAIHQYVVHGETHWANASDPSIPAALTPAVAGILSLHNFLKKPQSHLVKEPAPAKIVPGEKPQVTFPAQNGQPATNALGPEDYAVIYNINPTYGNGITGNGVTIGVVGRSNLFNGGEDVSDFRNYAFGICCGNFNILLNGPDPGDLGGSEEAEATLDSTWSGAIASAATVDLVVSATTNTTDGVDLSETYIVENNLADIMTESFSSCELYASDAQLAFSYFLAEQAAAQGISYFVSTGDDGAEGCDDPSAPPATHPISVNFLASTPFDTAVGGTMFNENGQNSRYWGTEPPVEESAISYIPEDVWNESSLSNGLWSSSGGASAGNIQGGLGGTTGGVPKPYWQSGVTGIPNDSVRDLPDVSLTAAGHDPYLLCVEGSCFPNGQGQFFIYFISGTSASAPSFAGIMALVDQQMGGRQGEANYVLYRLAATQAVYPSQCNGSNTSGAPASTCIFNDVTVGNNVVPGEQGSQYQAATGYDQTTGLGSVNVANLVTNWNTVTFNPTATTLGLSPVTSITHGQSVNVNITVTPNTGTGKPSGDISLLATTGPVTGQTGVDGFTLNASGQVASSTNQLPGGTYNVTAHYAGDATYAPSDSNAVSVTVGPENSTTTETILAFDQNGNPLSLNNVPFGSFVYVRADVSGVSGHGVPTGTVTFADTFGAIPGGSSFVLNSQGNTASPNGIAFDAGTHTISGSYSGDVSFNPSNTTQSQTVVITPGFSASVPTAGSQVVISAPGASGGSSVTIATSTGFSGTIGLACAGLPSESSCLFTPSSLTASGTPAQTAVAILVKTTAATAMLRSRQKTNYLAHWAAGSGLVFSVVLLGVPKRRRSRGLPLLAMLMLIVVLPGCGGGSGGGGGGPPPNQGTPPGTYNVVVNATSGSTTNSSGFTLIVE
ncbi:MAG: protease pro-enzyme activation domain-containing protein [Terriglobales bacterium]